MEKLTRGKVRELVEQWNGTTYSFNNSTSAPNTFYPTQIGYTTVNYAKNDEIDVLINIINGLIDELDKKQDKA